MASNHQPWAAAKPAAASPTLLSMRMGGYAAQDDHDYYETVRDHITAGTRVLDVGSGRGGLARWLRDKRGCDVTCIDASDEAVAGCIAKGLVIHQIDVNTESAAIPGQYDVVVFCSSLESIIDPCAVLSEIRKNIYRGGSLVIWTPNASFIASRLAYLKGIAPKSVGYSPEARGLGIRAYDDIQFFTKASLERL